MNRTRFYRSRQLAASLARAGGWDAGNGILYWAAVDELVAAVPLMRKERARGWVELWTARNLGCPVARALRGPRTVHDPLFTVRV